MFCTSCGAERANADQGCANCGGRPSSGQPAKPDPNPESYLIAGIVLCLCWCLPLGLVTLVYAAKGAGRLEAGDIAGAAECAKKAKMWAWIAFGTGLLIIGGYVVLFMIGFVSSLGANG